jgi:hypothetical protein
MAQQLDDHSTFAPPTMSALTSILFRIAAQRSTVKHYPGALGE